MQVPRERASRLLEKEPNAFLPFGGFYCIDTFSPLALSKAEKDRQTTVRHASATRFPLGDKGGGVGLGSFF
jgi:hypothetical protein